MEFQKYFLIFEIFSFDYYHFHKKLKWSTLCTLYKKIVIRFLRKKIYMTRPHIFNLKSYSSLLNHNFELYSQTKLVSMY